jgi:hypothetical protein
MRPIIRCLTGAAIAAAFCFSAHAENIQLAQYGYPPGYRPPCQAVTPSPLRGAARGAAGGAIFGAIGGNAGKGAAIGAGIGGVANIVRRGSARSSGYCY